MLLQCSSGCSAPDVAIEKVHTFCRFPTDITQCCVDVLCVAWTGHHPVCCVDVAPCCFSDLCVAMSNFAQSDNVKELEGWEMAGTDDASSPPDDASSNHFTRGDWGSSGCPGQTVPIDSSTGCANAASAITGGPMGTGKWARGETYRGSHNQSSYPSGCYLYHESSSNMFGANRQKVYWNTNSSGSKHNRAAQLCAVVKD